jgi:3-oxoacyl-[acyl-carrier-protein] synthase-3
MYFDGHVRIAATGSYVPERVVSNQELAAGALVDPDWVETRLGIFARRIASPDEFTSDLAATAARRALRAGGLAAEHVDLIIVATATPDRQAPSTACLVQEKLGLRDTPAFDVAAVCSGFLYGVSIASQYIETNAARTVLVIGADTVSRVTDWSHRDCVYFGDGAGAVVLTRSASSSPTLIGAIHADGRYKDAFTVLPGEPSFRMDGRTISTVGLDTLPALIRGLLSRAGLRSDDISCVIPHQAAVTLLHRVFLAADINFAVVRTNMARYANTAGATLPLLLDEVYHRDEIPAGGKVLFVAIGSGMTWGAMLYDWH